MTINDNGIHRLPSAMELHLELAQYPILADRVRATMREEIFARGIISADAFEQEVEEKALASQRREGIIDPFVQESLSVWQTRLGRVRDNLTDFYFAQNLPYDLFRRLLHDVLVQHTPSPEDILAFNPELAPWETLFRQAEQWENLPENLKSKVHHHLKEIIVVLIKGMISDQLSFVGRAKDLLQPSDLRRIHNRRIGRGKIGGKAAGMLLAWKALQCDDPEDKMDVRGHVVIPDSYFVGADVFYDYLALNDLVRFMSQKYKTREEIEAEYPTVREAHIGKRFPENVMSQFRQLLAEVGSAPLIVRSSSLLEDNYGMSFAGKYESHFCPNQGSLEENLTDLTRSISRIYASVLSPDALLYRRHKGLLDYDERMAVLIQKVQGKPYRRYFLPDLAGVAFSRNPFRWTARIAREDGFMRLVWGLGTRAVERVANDYPRMVALSHPRLRPEKTAREIQKYSQHFVDALDLVDNRFKTLPVSAVMEPSFQGIEYIASLSDGDWVRPFLAAGSEFAAKDLVLDFERLLGETTFVPLMKAILSKIERQIEYPVDVEFTADIVPDYPEPRFVIHLLQCRPQSSQDWAQVPSVPQDLPREAIVFSSSQLVPHGYCPGIRYIVYVDPLKYQEIGEYATRFEVARVVGRLNKALEGERFILVGPGRWGSTNPDLGVRVSYADIYNCLVLVEIAMAGDIAASGVSYGTHFYQDLVESNIYPLVVDPGAPGALFRRELFENSPNALARLLPNDAALAGYVRVIDVPAASGGRLLDIVMNGDEEAALGYLTVRS